MFWSRRPSRLDRIEASIETLTEVNTATNRRIDRFVEATDAQLQEIRAQTAQLQKAVEYLLSKDG